MRYFFVIANGAFLVHWLDTSNWLMAVIAGIGLFAGLLPIAIEHMGD